MKILLCAFLLFLVTERWPVDAVSTNALILRRFTREASLEGTFSNDTSVSVEDQVNSHWEEFIIPAPTTITLLGQLLVISSKVDFSLTENEPQGGFKYMRHPESFRASLVQVTNDGWEAFMNAHKNMDKIQLYMQQIPVQIKTSLKILSRGSSKVVEDLLPISLNEIQKIGQTCVDLSTETSRAFDMVMLLLGELLEVCTSSQGKYEQHLAEVQMQLNVTAIQKASLDTMAETLRKKQKEVDDEVAKYRQDYDQALKDIPTGWNAILQNAFQSVVNIANSIGSIFGGGKSGGDHKGGQTGGEMVADFDKSRIFAFVRGFSDQVQSMKSALNGLIGGTYDAKKGPPSSMFAAYLSALNYLESTLKKDPSDQLSSKALDFLNQGKQICQSLEDTYKTQSTNETQEAQKALKDFSDLETQMQPMIKEGEKNQGGLVMGQSGPTRQVMGDQSRYDGVGGNERYKADTALQRLRDAEARDDHYFDEVMKYQEEMKNLVAEIAKLNLQEINFEEILQLLTKGIHLLGEIRDQWTSLIQFFSMIAIRAEVALKHPLDLFLEQARKAEQGIGKGDLQLKDREFYLDLLLDEAQGINKAAYFLYTLSSTYFDVSTRFLMNRLAGLAQMLAADTEAKRQTLLGTLQTQANEAQDAIRQISQQKREEYKRLVDARQRELDDMIKKLDATSPTPKVDDGKQMLLK